MGQVGLSDSGSSAVHVAAACTTSSEAEAIDREEATRSNLEAVEVLGALDGDPKIEHFPVVKCPDGRECHGVTEPIIGYRTTIRVPERGDDPTVAMYGPLFDQAGWSLSCSATTGLATGDPMIMVATAFDGAFAVNFQDSGSGSLFEIQRSDASDFGSGFWGCAESGFTPSSST